MQSAAETSFTDEPLAPSTAYTYTVRAFDQAQNHSATSGSVNVTTLASNTDTIAPSTPANLTGYGVSTTTIQLNWDPATDSGGSGVASYRVYRSGNLAGSPTSNSFLDSGLTANTSYSYTIATVDGANNTSGQSSAVSVSTKRTIVFTDDFNRANEAMLPYPNWTYESAYYLGVQGNTAVAIHPVPTAQTWLTSYSVTVLNSFRATVRVLNNTDWTIRTGLVFWAVYNGGRYRAVMKEGGTTLQLEYAANATENGTLLGTATGLAGGPCTLTVEADSATRTIKVYHNGLLRLTYTETETSRPNSGKVGVSSHSNYTSVDAVVDDFTLEQ